MMMNNIDHVIICMEDMEMVKECNDYIKRIKCDDLNIFVYFVKDIKNIKMC